MLAGLTSIFDDFNKKNELLNEISDSFSHPGDTINMRDAFDQVDDVVRELYICAGMARISDEDIGKDEAKNLLSGLMNGDNILKGFLPEPLSLSAEDIAETIAHDNVDQLSRKGLRDFLFELSQ
ncbi:MAG: hypothetical protein COA45_01400 [Zetaproteobacteria bacterium]|nr:MAG: hypothetical protein COA45_01400 [Zetaproteobacteria bacterium]